jgi:hypothetical protein
MAALQKQLAQIVASVPDAALERYTPSINKKGFLKKWLWAIAGIVAIAAAVAGWWILSHQQATPERPRKEGPETDLVKRSTVTGHAAMDSSLDTLAKPGKPAPAAIRPESTAADSRSRIVSIQKDTTRMITKSMQESYSWSGKFITFSDQPGRKMEVLFYPQKGAAPTYELFGKLVLHSSYKTAAGLHFYSNENQVTMTDDKGGYYLLKKGAGEQLLVKQKGASK